MERTETIMVEVNPEKRQAEVRRRQDFGWTLTTGQEDAVMRDGTTQRKAKLLFTRTGPQENLDELKKLESELESLRTGVLFDDSGLVMADQRPTDGMPTPFVIAVTLVSGGLVTVILGAWIGIVTGMAAGTAALLYYRRRIRREQTEYRRRCVAATELFKKKQSVIVQQARLVSKAPGR